MSSVIQYWQTIEYCLRKSCCKRLSAMEGQAKRAYACVQHTCNTAINMFPCAYSVLFSLKPVRRSCCVLEFQLGKHVCIIDLSNLLHDVFSAELGMFRGHQREFTLLAAHRKRCLMSLPKTFSSKRQSSCSLRTC